jgi:hypothetical protein
MSTQSLKDSQGREVCYWEVEGSGVDAYFTKANYLTFTRPDGTYDVDDNELNYLTDTYPEIIMESCAERFAMRCEDAYDAARGH